MAQEEKMNALRKLPGVDVLLNEASVKELAAAHGIELVTYAARNTINSAREKILNGSPQIDLVSEVKNLIEKISKPSLKPVINATGIILHTNLGRAPLSFEPIRGYCNLEFDLETGKRGKREAHLKAPLKYITGAEDTLVVNNNAAAIVLILNTLASGKEVIISRGELIEIGGSFRINEIMASAGVKMVEVGTTNKTRLSDYENAVTENTALIFKAHKSNYSIKGFSEEVGIKELAEFSRKKGIPFVYDIGSGLLRKPKNLNLEGEPDVRSALKDGAYLVCFSGDKLLGGPQAGIIAGKKELISKLAKAPLMRALRVGKMTIAGLSAVCTAYLKDESLVCDIPIFKFLNRKPDDIKKLAEKLKSLLFEQKIDCEVVENKGHCGGGTLPDLEIASYAVRLSGVDAEKLFYKLLRLDRPILGILRKGEILFDLLTVEEKDLQYMGSAIK
ncbi:MAG: L-seryl-tRNA(Sec) selenium transferase [Candidatus Margulisiibacteriota bacterium]